MIDVIDDGVTSLPTLVRRIERHRELSDREGEATIQGGGEGVNILTVHDAKGMEFPVVVPKVSHQFNMQAAVGSGRVEFEEVGGEYAAGLEAPDPEDPFEMETTVAREVLKERRKAEERAEEKRVLYVACTRARDKLFLIGTHEVDGGDELSLTGIGRDDVTEGSDVTIPPDKLTNAITAGQKAAVDGVQEKIDGIRQSAPRAADSEFKEYRQLQE